MESDDDHCQCGAATSEPQEFCNVCSEPETIPTLADWIDQWEAAVIAGQSSISREEAERRYYEQYPMRFYGDEF